VFENFVALLPIVTMSDSPSAQLLQFVRYLAGHFNNLQQAIDDPVWFANIHVYHCPLPWSVFDGLGIYVEQAYDVYRDLPYRQGAYRVFENDEGMWIQNYALKTLDPFRGAGNDPERVGRMTADDLVELTGCLTKVVAHEGSFQGKSVPNKACRVVRKGLDSYLSVEFTLTSTEFRSLDRGLDPETDRVLWGSCWGPFQFAKVETFADFVPTAATSARDGGVLTGS
jgi:hypothetical protein